MFKLPTMTAIGLAMGLTVAAADAGAQTQSQTGQTDQGQQAQQQQTQQQQTQQQRQAQRGQGEMQGRGMQGEMSGMPVLVIFVDRDRDQMISREEARRAQEELFVILDADRDQQLTRDEYGGGMTREQTARYFESGDMDRDQQLTAREYLDIGEQRYRERTGEAGRQAREGLTISEYGETAGITEEEAGLADIDRDEMIAPDEAAYDTARRFRMLDRDNDGYVTHSELRRSELELRRDREFSGLDENDDDQLSREEFMAGTEDWQEEGSSFEYRAQQEEQGMGEGTGEIRTQSAIGRRMGDEGADEGAGEHGGSGGGSDQ